MLRVYAMFDERDDFYIVSFGRETDSKKARWGRGKRNSTIIHYVTKGEGYFNGAKIKSGEGFVIKSNQMHEYFSSERNPWEYFWVILNGDSAWDKVNEFIFPDENGKFTYNFKEELIGFCDEFFKKPEMISRAKAYGVFYLLMSYHQREETLSPNRYVSEAKKYMEQNIHRSIRITEIAGELFISDRYLYNLFMMYEKIPPKTYYNNLRIKKAKSLLKNKDLTITEVAVSVGFGDVLTFSRFFAKNVGMSPTSYRN